MEIIYILAGNDRIYKFDTRQYFKNGTNHLTAVDILTIDLQEYWGVNREGIWSWSVSETEESTKVMLFEEQGILRGKASIKKGRLQYIYGTKLYFSSEDGRVAQFDILNKTSKIVWDFRKEPYYNELEKIRKSRGLKTLEFTTSFHGIAANENYVVVRYETYCDDDKDDSCIRYIEPTKKMDGAADGVEACNVSCCDLNTGEQTLLYGGEWYEQVENWETIIAEEYLYGPFGIVKVNEDFNYNGRVTDVEGRCVVIGMDIASNEIYFLWRSAGDREWKKKIYSASIRDFLIREVEKNKVLCWKLEHDYSHNVGYAGQYFCGEYFYGDIAHNVNNEKMVILGRDGSRVDLAYVDDRNRTPVLDCTAGAWIWGYREYYDGCFKEYFNDGEDYTLFAIDTRPLSAERCLHINGDEFTKTKADLTAAQDDCGKQKRLVAEPEDTAQKNAEKKGGYCIHCGMQLHESARFCMGCGKPVTNQMRNDGWNIQPQKQSTEAADREKADGWHQEFHAEFSKTFKSLEETTALAQDRIADIRIVLPKKVHGVTKIIINWDGYLKNVPKRMVEILHAGTNGRFTEFLYRNQAGRTESSSSLLLVREKDELAGRTAGESSNLWKEMNNAKYFIYQGYGHMDAIRAIKHICNLFFKYLREEEGYSIDFSGEDVMIEYKLKSRE